jgi:ketosteroid isomerase-like protein
MSTMTVAVPAKPAEAIRYLITRSYQSALHRQDADAYANLYTEDVLWAHPEIPDAHTKEAVRKGIKRRFDAYSFQVAIKPVEIEVMGDFACP